MKKILAIVVCILFALSVTAVFAADKAMDKPAAPAVEEKKADDKKVDDKKVEKKAKKVKKGKKAKKAKKEEAAPAPAAEPAKK
ncbi:MAG TPA: hypothetical protein VK452_06345 [Dissulfurispiraceae bacterium]|nr:hypothetical protein [Dissulfurispiraceae bacterium]